MEVSLAIKYVLFLGSEFCIVTEAAIRPTTELPFRRTAEAIIKPVTTYTLATYKHSLKVQSYLMLCKPHRLQHFSQVLMVVLIKLIVLATLMVSLLTSTNLIFI